MSSSNSVVVYLLDDWKYYICNIVPQSSSERYDDLMVYLKDIQWVMLHPVRYVLEIRENEIIENVVLEYMKRHGVNNVRASIEPYNETLFDDDIRREIEMQVDTFILTPKQPIKRVSSNPKLSGAIYAYAN
jgi:hypothetical protein